MIYQKDHWREKLLEFTPKRKERLYPVIKRA
jgi:hypothetical protein